MKLNTYFNLDPFYEMRKFQPNPLILRFHVNKQFISFKDSI